MATYLGIIKVILARGVGEAKILESTCFERRTCVPLQWLRIRKEAEVR